MGSFFFGLLRSGTIADVREKLHGLDVEVAGLEPYAPTLVTVPQPTSPQGLDGAVNIGPVSIQWSNGTPLKAYDLRNSNRWAIVPADLWAIIRRETPADEWLSWLYLGFLESDFVANAKNPSDAEDSWGVWQVNRNAWPQYSPEYLSTYEGNMQAAIAIKAIQGWGAWYYSALSLGLISD